MPNEVLRLLTKAAIPVTHATVDALLVVLRQRGSPEFASLLADAEEVRRMIEALEVRQGERSPPPQEVRESFAAAISSPLSKAAKGSLHDKIRAKHRPGGKVLPRPRWSVDEEPLDGWDLGTHTIEHREKSGADLLVLNDDGSLNMDATVAGMLAQANGDMDKLGELMLSLQAPEVRRHRKPREVRQPEWLTVKPQPCSRHPPPWATKVRRAVLRCTRPQTRNW